MIMAVQERWSAYLLIAIYSLTMILIAILTRRKSKSLDGFILGNRQVGGWLSAFGYGTTYFSATVFIGYAGTFGMSLGLAGIWIGIANAIIGSFLAWKVLAKRTRNMTQNLNARTLSEFFEKRYDTKGLKILSAAIIFMFLIPYSTSVYQGIGYICQAVFGVKFYVCVLVMATLTAIYVFVGGYIGNAISNFVQGVIMLSGAIMIIVLMLKAPQVNGIEGLRKLTEAGYGIIPKNSISQSWLDAPGLKLIINILLTSFGIWAVPQSIQKFFAIKNEKAIFQGLVVSTGFALIVGGAAYLNGGLARLFFPTAAPGAMDEIVPDMFLANQPYMNYAALGFICILVVAASMSTLSTLSLVSSTSVVVDVYKGVIKPQTSENKIRLLVSILAVCFIAISAALAMAKVSAIVTLMSLSWGTLAGCFIGPYVYGLYSKKANKIGGYISMIGTLVLTIILIFVFGSIEGGQNFGQLISLGIKRAPFIGVVCMVFSVIATPLGMLFKKEKVSTETISICFPPNQSIVSEEVKIQKETEISGKQ